MVDQEIYKLELELEITRVELEIKEIELEMYKNSYESIKIKEAIEELYISEEIFKDYIGNLISENPTILELSPDIETIKPYLKRMGALAYKNYCLEDEKLRLCSFKKELENKISSQTSCVLPNE